MILKLRIFGEEWRRGPESNRRIEVCSPRPYHLATSRAPKHLLSIDFAPLEQAKSLLL